MNEEISDFYTHLQETYPDVVWEPEAAEISHIPLGWRPIIIDMFEEFSRVSKGISPNQPRLARKFKTWWNRFVYRAFHKFNKTVKFAVYGKFQFDMSKVGLVKGTVHIEQIKDKFAELRVYYFFKGNPVAETYVEAAISMAERASVRTCQHTGNPGTLRRGGWLVILCDEEWEKLKQKREKRNATTTNTKSD